MGKNIKIPEDTQNPFSGHRSYSITEIMDAGGTTAFANKLGKNPQSIGDRLKQLPKEAFLTNEEAMLALKILDESK